MTLSVDLRIERARPEDVEGLLQLYFQVYGGSYPYRIATDSAAMAEALTSPDLRWFVARDVKDGELIGSIWVELDRQNRIGKIVGLVVSAEHRGRGIASRLVSAATRDALSPESDLNSLYTTARTASVVPQLLFLKEGFLPLGIFPNARRVADYETHTLLAKFRPGLLERRAVVDVVPEKVAPILAILDRHFGIPYAPKVRAPQPVAPFGPPTEFELIFAPHYVRTRFRERCTDPYQQFYPFHTPNVMAAATDGSVELYAYFSKPDRYCALITRTRPYAELAGKLRPLLNQLKDAGVSYIETLVGLEQTASLEVLLEEKFLPSAVYPAMMMVDGIPRDMLVMSRTLEPLNFQGMQIERSFKPYVDQYVELWKQMHLEALAVFENYEKTPAAPAICRQ